MKGLEREVRMIPLSGSTADEIAQEYAKVVTDAFRSAEKKYSVNNGDMMLYAPHMTCLREIMGKYYAELEYSFYGNDTTEEDDDE